MVQASRVSLAGQVFWDSWLIARGSGFLIPSLCRNVLQWHPLGYILGLYVGVVEKRMETTKV